MVRDDDHFEDFNDICLQNLVYNDNVMKQAGSEPEEYLFDDSEEWYNIDGSEADV
jgi:hypothetical protein